MGVQYTSYEYVMSHSKLTIIFIFQTNGLDPPVGQGDRDRWGK